VRLYILRAWPGPPVLDQRAELGILSVQERFRAVLGRVEDPPPGGLGRHRRAAQSVPVVSLRSLPQANIPHQNVPPAAESPPRGKPQRSMELIEGLTGRHADALALPQLRHQDCGPSFSCLCPCEGCGSTIAAAKSLV